MSLKNRSIIGIIIALLFFPLGVILHLQRNISKENHYGTVW